MPTTFGRLGFVACGWGIVTVLPQPAAAVVDHIDASATVQVQESVGSTVLNSDQSVQQLNESTNNFPLEARASLSTTEQSGDELTGILSVATCRDPRATTNANPGEFGMSVVGFSTEDQTYTASAQLQETRQITFTADEIGEAARTTIQARSRFYTDAVLLLWSEAGGSSLADSQVEFTVSVVQKRPDSAPVEVLHAVVALAGNADGTASLHVDGALQRNNLIALNLSDLDLDLSDSEMAQVQMVMLPQLGIPYVYNADVEESFELVAQIQGNILTQPGVGAAIELGTPLGELTSFINNLTGSTEDVGSLLTKTASNQSPLEPLPMSNETKITVLQRSLIPLNGCGALGVETLGGALLALGLFLPALRRGRA